MKTHYINTDLDLAAWRDITPLTAALATRKMCVLHVTLGDDSKGRATIEMEKPCFTPEETIAAMLDAVESLESWTRAKWFDCTHREFNIGYECGTEPFSFGDGLTNETLRRVAQLGASLGLTLYTPFLESNSSR